MKCRICKNTNLIQVLSLGHHPPSDAFLTKEKLQEPETHYPLDLYYCKECGLAQLGYVVSKEDLFSRNYPYETGVNQAGVEHFTHMAESLVERYGLGYNDLVVDIGGNDGTLGRAFKEIAHCAVINVDPSDVESKVFKIEAFWNEETAQYIRSHYSIAKCITATNVFAHVDDLHAFMRGVDILLADDGVFVIESPDFIQLLNRLQYDTIYHEHLSYLHQRPIEYLIKQYDMEIAERTNFDFHAGSVRYEIKRVSAQCKSAPADTTKHSPRPKGRGESNSGGMCICQGKHAA